MEDFCYKEAVPADFGPGYYVETTAILQNPCEQFTLDFIASTNNFTDVSFRLNPRLTEKKIVRNHLCRNIWGTEENHFVTHFDALCLNVNSYFKITVLLTASEYVVEINGKYVCQFPFRMQPRSVRFIEFRGNCTNCCFKFKNLSMLPQLGGGRPLSKCVEIMRLENSQRFSIIPGDFGPGYYVEVKGYLLKTWFRFNLDFIVEINASNISFHLELCLNNMNKIMLNDRISKIWGEEQTVTHKPFISYLLTAESYFRIGILVNSSKYLVEINGTYVGALIYRVHPSRVKYLDIKGDCEIYDVSYKNFALFQEFLQ